MARHLFIQYGVFPILAPDVASTDELLTLSTSDASRRTGRAPKSTKDAHWIRIAGADQIERA